MPMLPTRQTPNAPSGGGPLPFYFRFQAAYPRCSLKRRLAAQNLRLEVSDAALDLIAESGFDPIYGARPLKRAIQAEIENPLAKALLNGQYAPESTIRIDAQGEHLIFA